METCIIHIGCTTGLHSRKDAKSSGLSSQIRAPVEAEAAHSPAVRTCDVSLKFAASVSARVSLERPTYYRFKSETSRTFCSAVWRVIMPAFRSCRTDSSKLTMPSSRCVSR